MSKFLYVCARDALPEQTLGIFGRISARLTPREIGPRQPRLNRAGNIAFAIFNPSETTMADGESLGLGCFFGVSKNWSRPRAPMPDGSYALVRTDSYTVEVVSDPAGSRSLWILKTEHYFVCSTSQRAILMFVGDFSFDQRVMPWILSTGTLGPSLSWDRRIERVPPDSSLILDRRAWLSTWRCKKLSFEVQGRSRRQHRAALIEAIDETFSSTWSYRPNTLIVPLSGGYDSRSILCFVHRNLAASTRLETITWGLADRCGIPGTDASVAAEVAKALGIPNRFVSLEDEAIEPELVLERFIACSEGRIDHIAGYVDGMSLWRQLYESNINFLLRGDEGFGWVQRATERAVRYSLDFGLTTDYENLDSMLRKYAVAPNRLPDEYLRHRHESIPAWRDRLYHLYRIPTILGALSDIKYSYVELLNPLLSRRILQQVRAMPDHLRTNKALFREIAVNIGPKIPYAKSHAIATTREVVGQPGYAGLIAARLREQDGARSPLPTGMLDSIANGMHVRYGNSAAIAVHGHRSLPRLVPRFIRDRLRDFKPQRLDGNVLGLRAFILVSTLKLIADDCDAMRRAG